MKRNWLKLIFWFGIVSLSTFNFVLAQVDPGIRDTCQLSRIETVPPNSQVVMDVYAFNDEDLGAFIIPLAFVDSNSYLDIRCDSISFVGTRSANASLYSDTFSIDNNKKRLDVYAVWINSSLAPGSGSVAKIYFTTGPFWNSPWYQWVDTISWPIGGGGSIGLEFWDTLGSNIFCTGVL